MQKTNDADPQLVSVAALDAWLGDRLPGSGPLRVDRVTSGHSNELFEIHRGGPVWILRRPPLVPNAPGAHDMSREHRVLVALEGSRVPHAAPHALCDDPSVIGAPFYVMERIEGVSFYETLPEQFSTERRAVAFALVDALAALHTVDWRAAGLATLGRPDGYTERQATRWSAQLESYGSRPLPELLEVGAWLASRCPGTSGQALIHGDFGLHNVLFSPTPPVELRAVVDWETATIGDPLADLGYLLKDWLEATEDRFAALAPPHGMSGYPTRAEMVERYAAGVGRDVSCDDVTWYRVLGQFKIAVILEGSYCRFVRGESADPFFATLEERVPFMARHALAIAHGEA